MGGRSDREKCQFEAVFQTKKESQSEMVGIFYVLGGLGVTSAGPNGVGLLGLGLGLGLGSIGIIIFYLYYCHFL